MGRERANLAVLARSLERHRPDVVSVWAMGAMSFSVLDALSRARMPTVTVICDEWPVYGPRMDGWLRRFLGHRALGAVIGRLTGLPTTSPSLDELGPACFVSEALRSSVRRQTRWSFPESTVVYSGIDPELFTAPGASGGWRWRLLVAGRIDDRKGIDVAIRSLAACPGEATLSVVGQGDDRYLEELRRLAAGLGVDGRVSFHSAGRAELADLYRAADAVVFPPTWEEPFGLVPLEAMACGTPVVASATGGSAEFLADGANCLTFAAGDGDALASCLMRLATDGPLRQRLIQGGVTTAAALGVDRLAEVLEQWHAWAGGAGDRPADRHLPSFS